MNISEEQVMSADEVATFLRLSRAHIYQLKSENKIPFHKVGGALRFLKSEIIEWVKTQNA